MSQINAHMLDALKNLLATVERLDIREGVCCDAGEYHHGQVIEQARAVIAEALALPLHEGSGE